MGPCFPEMPLLGTEFSERKIERKKKNPNPSSQSITQSSGLGRLSSRCVNGNITHPSEAETEAGRVCVCVRVCDPEAPTVIGMWFCVASRFFFVASFCSCRLVYSTGGRRQHVPATGSLSWSLNQRATIPESGHVSLSPTGR